MRLIIVPLTCKDANRKVGAWHRHNRPTTGGLFACGVALDGELVGVGIAGRPIARKLDDGKTVEITRVATMGEKNACSKLYGALCRAAMALGYSKAITYTLAEEPGCSLRAAGFEKDAEIPARAAYSTPGSKRQRVQVDLFGQETRPPGPKIRWVREL